MLLAARYCLAWVLILLGECLLNANARRTPVRQLGGHTSNVMDLAERDPSNPSITELDRAKDKADSRKAENVGKLPRNPTPEALKRIEEILKERNP